MNYNLIKFVRKLLKDRQFELAKNIIDIIEAEYPFLKFEYNLFIKNFEEALEIFKNLSHSDLQSLYNIENLENLNLGELLNKIYSSIDDNINYDEIKSEIPEISQLIIFELEKATKEKNRSNEQYLKDLLSKFEKNNYFLKEEKSNSSNFNIIFMSLLVVTLIFTIISLFNPVFFSIKNSINNIESNITSNYYNIKNELSKLNNVANEVFKNTSSLVESSQKMLEKDNSSTINNYFVELKNEIEKLKVQINYMSSKISTSSPLKNENSQTTLFEKFDPNSNETLRFMWLIAYQYYKQKNYIMAKNILETIIDKALSHNLNYLYFIDDVYYYRALIYYEIGDFENSYLLFNDFIERFPNSTYKKHAEYFIKILGGLKWFILSTS